MSTRRLNAAICQGYKPIYNLQQNQSNPFASRYLCGPPNYLEFFDFAPFCANYSDNLGDSCTIFGQRLRTVSENTGSIAVGC